MTTYHGPAPTYVVCVGHAEAVMQSTRLADGTRDFDDNTRVRR